MPKKTIYYWRQVAATKPGLLAECQPHLQALLAGRTKEADLAKKYAVTKIPGCRIYTIKINDKGRVLLASLKIHGANTLLVLGFDLEHKYNSPFLQPGFLKQYLEQHVTALQRQAVQEGRIQFDAVTNHPFAPDGDASVDESAGTELDFQPVSFHQHAPIILSQCQASIFGLMKKHRALVLTGPPGSGKSSVLLELIKQASTDPTYFPKGTEIFLVTESSYLRAELQVFWRSSPEAIAYGQGLKVHFLDDRGMMMRYADFDITRREVDQSHCIAWIQQKIAAARSAIVQGHQDAPSLRVDAVVFQDAENIYQAMRMLSGYHQRDDLDCLGRQSFPFPSPVEKDWLWGLLASYRSMMDDAHLIHWPLYCLPAWDQVNKGVLLVDESMDLSRRQIHQLHQMFKDSLGMVLTMDAHQTVSGAGYSDLVYVLGLDKRFQHVKLPVTYRCGRQIAKLADRVLKVKQYIVPSDEKDIYTDIVPSLILGEGVVQWVNDRASINRIRLAYSGSVDFAVVTTPDRVGEARDHFGTPNVFTDGEVGGVKGLEFECLVLYRWFHQSGLVWFENALPDDDAIPLPERPHRAKAGQEIAQGQGVVLARLLVAVTRAKERLIIFQEDKHGVQKLIRRVRDDVSVNHVQDESVAASASSGATKDLGQSNTASMNESVAEEGQQTSSEEEWKQHAIKLLKRGLVSQARNVLSQECDLKEDQWPQWCNQNQLSPELEKQLTQSQPPKKKKKNKKKGGGSSSHQEKRLPGCVLLNAIFPNLRDLLSGRQLQLLQEWRQQKGDCDSKYVSLMLQLDIASELLKSKPDLSKTITANRLVGPLDGYEADLNVPGLCNDSGHVICVFDFLLTYFTKGSQEYRELIGLAGKAHAVLYAVIQGNPSAATLDLTKAFACTQEFLRSPQGFERLVKPLILLDSSIPLAKRIFAHQAAFFAEVDLSSWFEGSFDQTREDPISVYTASLAGLAALIQCFEANEDGRLAWMQDFRFERLLTSVQVITDKYVCASNIWHCWATSPILMKMLCRAIPSYQEVPCIDHIDQCLLYKDTFTSLQMGEKPSQQSTTICASLIKHPEGVRLLFELAAHTWSAPMVQHCIEWGQHSDRHVDFTEQFNDSAQQINLSTDPPPQGFRAFTLADLSYGLLKKHDEAAKQQDAPDSVGKSVPGCYVLNPLFPNLRDHMNRGTHLLLRLDEDNAVPLVNQYAVLKNLLRKEEFANCITMNMLTQPLEDTPASMIEFLMAAEGEDRLTRYCMLVLILENNNAIRLNPEAGLLRMEEGPLLYWAGLFRTILESEVQEENTNLAKVQDDLCQLIVSRAQDYLTKLELSEVLHVVWGNHRQSMAYLLIHPFGIRFLDVLLQCNGGALQYFIENMTVGMLTDRLQLSEWRIDSNILHAWTATPFLASVVDQVLQENQSQLPSVSPDCLNERHRFPSPQTGALEETTVFDQCSQHDEGFALIGFLLGIVPWGEHIVHDLLGLDPETGQHSETGQPCRAQLDALLGEGSARLILDAFWAAKDADSTSAAEKDIAGCCLINPFVLNLQSGIESLQGAAKKIFLGMLRSSEAGIVPVHNQYIFLKFLLGTKEFKNRITMRMINISPPIAILKQRPINIIDFLIVGKGEERLYRYRMLTLILNNNDEICLNPDMRMLNIKFGEVLRCWAVVFHGILGSDVPEGNTDLAKVQDALCQLIVAREQKYLTSLKLSENLPAVWRENIESMSYLWIHPFGVRFLYALLRCNGDAQQSFIRSLTVDFVTMRLTLPGCGIDSSILHAWTAFPFLTSIVQAVLEGGQDELPLISPACLNQMHFSLNPQTYVLEETTIFDQCLRHKEGLCLISFLLTLSGWDTYIMCDLFGYDSMTRQYGDVGQSYRDQLDKLLGAGSAKRFLDSFLSASAGHGSANEPAQPGPLAGASDSTMFGQPPARGGGSNGTGYRASRPA